MINSIASAKNMVISNVSVNKNDPPRIPYSKIDINAPGFYVAPPDTWPPENAPKSVSNAWNDVMGNDPDRLHTEIFNRLVVKQLMIFSKNPEISPTEASRIVKGSITSPNDYIGLFEEVKQKAISNRESSTIIDKWDKLINAVMNNENKAAKNNDKTEKGTCDILDEMTTAQNTVEALTLRTAL